MQEKNTNNYTEARHNTLKSRYLGSFRKQRTAILVHLLLREFLPDFRIKFARVTLGLEGRILKNSKTIQLKLCTNISSEEAASLVRHIFFKVEKAKHWEAILVKSLTNEGQKYLVSLNQASTISCSCKYMAKRYSIYYNIRLSVNVGFDGKSLPNLTAKPTTETEVAIWSDDGVKAK